MAWAQYGIAEASEPPGGVRIVLNLKEDANPYSQEWKIGELL
jgi:HSP90 family molecular chaperone